MLLGNPYKFLDEAATADLLDPAVSDEAKDVVTDLQDDLTNNIEEVKPDDMVTNGGVPITTSESAILVESTRERGKYYVAMEAVMAICEDEVTNDTGETGEDIDPDDAAEKANNVVDRIAADNGVDPEDVTVIISAEECAYVCECVINEAKCGKGKKSKKKKAMRKAKLIDKIAKALGKRAKVFKKKK
jgi:hypothetical protein